MDNWEHYAPTNLDEAILSPWMKADLKRMVAANRVPNLLFYGEPGTGKTCVARLLSNNITFFPCSEMKTDADVEKIAKTSVFPSAGYSDEGQRLVVWDDFDEMGIYYQSVVSENIASRRSNASHILTINSWGYMSKDVKERLQKWLLPVCFTPDECNWPLMREWRIRLAEIFIYVHGRKPKHEDIEPAIEFFPDATLMISYVLHDID